MLSRVLLASLILLLSSAEAAGATERYAAPDGSGGVCTEADPCNISNAIENPAVVDGDEIILLGGTYALSASQRLQVADAITIRAADPAARPIISGSPEFLLVVNDAATVRDLEIVHSPTTISDTTSSGLWVLDDGAVVERVAVTGYGGGIACNVPQGTLRDSTCHSFGLAATGSQPISNPGVYASNLVNVTAISDGGSGLGMLVQVPGADFTASVSARNSIIGSAFVQVEGATTTSTASATLESSNFQFSDTEDDDGESVTAPGTGTNQTDPPLLVHGPGFEGDFHQLEGSPTIDSGAPDPLLGLLDFEREDRIMGEAVDIGADEFFVEDEEPPPVEDTTPPQTTITDRPKAKVKLKEKKRKAPYSFSFVANEASTFRCSLDDKPEVSCTSPFAGKVKKGTHTFSVYAIDTAGNEDATPATATWKVKKKKKKRR